MKKILIFSFLINFLFPIDFQKDKYKISFQPLLLFNYDYAQRKSYYTIIRTNSFYFSKVYLDLLSSYEDFCFLKFSLNIADLEGKPSYELYGKIKPKKEIAIILGKFKQNLGYEVSLSPKESYFSEPSLIYYFHAPDIYDLGIGIFYYKEKKWELNFNIINGVGRNFYFDNNEWKDISGRFLFKPNENLFLGSNFYYGKIGVGKVENLLPFFRLGFEIGYLKSPDIFIFEYLYGKEKNYARYNYYKYGGYFLFGHKIENLFPVIRLDFRKERSEVRDLGECVGFAFGINYFLKDYFKVAPYFYYYYFSKNDYLIKFVFQFQISIY